MNQLTINGSPQDVKSVLASGPQSWSDRDCSDPTPGFAPAEEAGTHAVWKTSSHNPCMFWPELEAGPWRDEQEDLLQQSITASCFQAAIGGAPVIGPVCQYGILPMLPTRHMHWLLVATLDYVGGDRGGFRMTVCSSSKWSPLWNERDIGRISKFFPRVDVCYRFAEQGNGFVGKVTAAEGKITDAMHRHVTEDDLNPDYDIEDDDALNNRYRGEFGDILARSG